VFVGQRARTGQRAWCTPFPIVSLNDCLLHLFFKVILCGAATKMCKLQQLVKDKFPSNCKLLNQISPDECIALGCAKQSNIIANSKLTKFTADQDRSFKAVAHEIFMRVNGHITSCKWAPSLHKIPTNCLSSSHFIATRFQTSTKTKRRKSLPYQSTRLYQSNVE
jgi:molecular chaperone DnaK (HSP70)